MNILEIRTCHQLKESFKQLKKKNYSQLRRCFRGKVNLGFHFFILSERSAKREHVGSLAKVKHILCKEANIQLQNVKTETP